MPKIDRCQSTICACISSSALAGVSGLHNTGEAGLGIADSYYTLISVPSGPSTAMGISAPSGVDHRSGRLRSGSVPTAANVTDPVGWYTYELTFTITDVDPSTVIAHGRVERRQQPAKSGSTDVFHGHRQGRHCHVDTLEYKTIEDFVIASGFQSGENTLEFRVYNLATGERTQSHRAAGQRSGHDLDDSRPGRSPARLDRHRPGRLDATPQSRHDLFT